MILRLLTKTGEKPTPLDLFYPLPSPFSKDEA
jgi:hypothetical protein